MALSPIERRLAQFENRRPHFPVSASAKELFDTHALAVNRRMAHPAVNSSSIVSDLKARSLDRLDQMQVLVAIYLTEHDVADLQGRWIDGFNRTQLS